MRPSLVAQAIAHRVELLVAHRVVVRLAAARVRGGQPIELAPDGIRLRAHRLVAADQIRVRVDQHDVAIAQPAGGVQIEEHRAAAEERLDVAVERRRIEAAQAGQQLAFAAGPFQQGRAQGLTADG